MKDQERLLQSMTNRNNVICLLIVVSGLVMVEDEKEPHRKNKQAEWALLLQIDVNNINIYIIMGKKDVFSKVEADAIKKLEQPVTAGAAKTVLEYIAEQRSKTTN